MTSPFDTSQVLAQFTGRAPLFPLPNVVCFPHVLLPLHIFEPRYRRMLADVLEGQALLAMALIRPEGIADAAGTPPIFPMVCLGRIAVAQQLPDGRSYLMLQGVTRARVLNEPACDKPYRVAELELCGDYYPGEPVIDREHRYRELLDGFREYFSPGNLDQVLHQALDAEIPLGVLCDVLTYAMQLDVPLAQRILDELDVDFRSDLVLDEIRAAVRRRRRGQNGHRFPPPFSRN